MKSDTLLIAECAEYPPPELLMEVARRFRWDAVDQYPKIKSLSDAELLERYDGRGLLSSANEAYDIRSHILERLKARGPNRGEVKKRLWDYLNMHQRLCSSCAPSSEFESTRNDFLSMFPEDTQ
ncbi:MAG: hypothetical protein RIB97_13220 [Nitratireductor sp.]